VKLEVKEIDYKIAKPHIVQWHYSHIVPRGRNIFYGWYVEDELYAVANFGWGVNPYQAKYLARTTGFLISNDNLMELKRLARSEPRRDPLQLTQFLATCFRLLKQKGVRYIISFSDPEWKHTGKIYQAANFKHIGQTQEEMHVVDSSGAVHHRRYPYRYAKRNGCTMEEAREQLGLKPIKTQKKDRWFYAI
jgi:hypothetical protein